MNAAPSLAPDGGIGADAGFDALRSAGIAALQRLCGEVWTDFNLHDPGVTTLEQLAYGLTDLAYRTGFDMADYLAGPDGDIDYQALALYAPEQILPCAALTIDDYRRLLYGEIPELADVWIGAEPGGLLAIDVLAAPDAQRDSGLDSQRDSQRDSKLDSQPGAEALARRVEQVYAAHRALGADLARVRVLRPRSYYLRGKIETCGERPQAEVLARILFDCGAYLSSGLSARRLRDLIAAGMAPEDVFDGPATRHGNVEVRPQADDGAPVGVSELIGVIQRIEGVRRIRSLEIVDDALRPCAQIPRARAAGVVGVLPFPVGEVEIELLQLQPEQGIEYGVSEQQVAPTPAWRAANRALYAEGWLELVKLRFEQRALRADEGQTRFALPAGRHRALHAYYSVQHEFPAVYGVGRFGLPDSASDERKAQARQLQGFLYPMEQLMANYLQNLQDFPRLFGVAAPQAPSYATQYLDGPAAPGLDTLYAADPEATRARLRRVLARHDDHAERKGRVYDYLLALYGDAFPQTALRRFNHYHLDDTDAWLLDAKRRLLEAQVELGRGRARGCDVLQELDAPGAVPPLARRAAILLGFDDGARYRSLCPSWDGAALALAEQADGATPRPAPADWLPVPPPAADEAAILRRMRAPRGALPESLFRDGALLANYRLARDGDQDVLWVQGGARWYTLGRYAGRADAVAAAHAAATALAQSNRRCEGMHVVEHILLRPRGADGIDAPDQHGNPAFYDGRLSVVLPRWTLRCADRAFRNLVEETVREHCPAHLYPTFLWLAPGQMARFEALHAGWRAALRSWRQGADGERQAHGATLHDAAGALVHFLREQRKDPT